MKKANQFLEYLSSHLLVGDGAMATLLYQQGVPIGVCYEELSLSKPNIVRNVHQAYYRAGARFIETNTFGAHREGLARYGLEDMVAKINLAAVKNARDAVGEDAFVFGSMGSITSGRVRQTKMEGYREQFEEQAIALLQGGADGLILETFLDLEELLLALEVIRPLTSLPIIAQLATIEVGRTRDGYSLTEAFQLLKQHQADVVGLNCRLGPLEILRSLEQTIVPDDILISVFPNAGRLGLSEGEYAYKSSPEYFAKCALQFRKQGVHLIGGCCGTSPEHIQMISEILEGLDPLPRKNPEKGLEDLKPRATIHEIDRKKPNIVDLVQKRHTVIVEWDSPRDLDIDIFLKGAAKLQEAGVDAITIADNSLATTRISNMAMGAILKNRLGIEPLVHITCRDRNLIGQQSHLMGLHALGIEQILVITGDPARFGDLPGSSSVFDVSSFDLIRMVKQLNEGLSFSGKILKQRARFVVGAAFNPHVRHFDAAVKRLEQKVEAGADFIMTQPVYDAESIHMIYEGTKYIPVPIFIGIMPLTSARNADFLHHEVPGIKLSESALKRIRMYQGEEARKEGVAMAKELLEVAMDYFNGIYLITPFHYYEMTAELADYVYQKRSNSAVFKCNP
ncbi:bifunctional homocysteine S-methyltransferase/methylenetetrahydrofolate reductase [Microaerobacter geothermalis]|uniref:bifunctional homocysteine S-methyltransferase/methylenetetrahydrofolate reductase n=1 Tax=Microaerobacter geothermalis TaxID=674972 RepID=UPI001F21F918|nr:bifunctional homocysteine S-methyltransferase/methylenetetrahydrofolate reductase [Microaerobacter geothermalis]MCF6094222.1 bifunctional homocysteine S-methyltransferase/methylenetetrahydrofolate reductase [Microaerobacter geothermalis]